jgi:hypothetical protein
LSDRWRETEAVTAPHWPSLERRRVVPRVEGTSGAVECRCFREPRQEAALQGARRFGVAGPASSFSLKVLGIRPQRWERPSSMSAGREHPFGRPPLSFPGGGRYW